MIDEKAIELGRTIGQSTEYQALRRAEKALREDAEAQAKVDAIQQLADQLEGTMAEGGMPDAELTERYRDAVRDLQLSTTGQTYVVARANFEKLMGKVNEKIGEGMEKGATSSIITI